MYIAERLRPAPRAKSRGLAVARMECERAEAEGPREQLITWLQLPDSA
jgi:hypothetical protein